MFFEKPLNFRSGTVAIIRQRFNHNGYSARRITFIEYFFKTDRSQLAGPFFYGFCDSILGHIGRFGLVDCISQRQIRSGVAPAGFCGNDYHSSQFAPHLAAPGIDDCLFISYSRPV